MVCVYVRSLCQAPWLRKERLLAVRDRCVEIKCRVPPVIGQPYNLAGVLDAPERPLTRRDPPRCRGEAVAGPDPRPDDAGQVVRHSTRRHEKPRLPAEAERLPRPLVVVERQTRPRRADEQVHRPRLRIGEELGHAEIRKNALTQRPTAELRHVEPR